MRRAATRLLARFAAAREATAAVEFALILPLMLLLYIGSQELSALIIVDQRVTNIAGTVGDLVARTDTCLPSATLDDYFQAAEAILGDLPTDQLKQVITEVQVDDTGTATVEWSKAYNGATPRTSFSFDSASTADVFKNSYVIVAEASYPYKPLLGLFLKNTFNLYRSNYYVPRFGTAITVTTTCT